MGLKGRGGMREEGVLSWEICGSRGRIFLVREGLFHRGV